MKVPVILIFTGLGALVVATIFAVILYSINVPSLDRDPRAKPFRPYAELAKFIFAGGVAAFICFLVTGLAA